MAQIISHLFCPRVRALVASRPSLPKDFARFEDPDHVQFGSLRVINEDRVQAHTGFGSHPHREFEIFSYVVSGQIEQ